MGADGASDAAVAAGDGRKVKAAVNAMREPAMNQ